MGNLDRWFLHRTWFEFLLWLAIMVFTLQFLTGQAGVQVNWWQPSALMAIFLILFLLIRHLGYNAFALPLVSVLVAIGWLFLARLDPSWATRQFYGAVLGIIAFLFGVFIPFEDLKYPILWLVLSFALLWITALVGVRIGGARAWLSIFGLRFQPVEFSRILFFFYLAPRLMVKDNRWFIYLSLVGFSILLIWQRDLGPILLMFLVFCTLDLSYEFKWWKVASYLIVSFVGFGATLFIFPHFQTRTLAWLWPWNYVDSQGYQVLQGLFALQAGGIFGRGFGLGMDQVIPAIHTDYLLAIIGEELGLLGSYSLILLYLALAFWAFYSLQRAADTQQKLVGLAFTLLLHCQVFMVVGGILRLVPFTGMTLPFVSFGSSSLIAQFFMLGFLTKLGREES